MSHIRGRSRYQSRLFAESLDELVSAEHPVRVVDAFVNSLDLATLGFGKVQARATGRPPYDPGDLLKLYVYGYLNQVRSSRRLERESQRNVELMWLVNRLTPNFKTIANFRKDHGQALLGVCHTFVRFCREQRLFGGELVSLDGSKFKANASKKQVYTPARLAKELEKIDQRIGEYFKEMDAADALEGREEVSDGQETANALTALKERREALQALATKMSDEGLKQYVSTDPDAKLMRQSSGGHGVSYNVQTAVDAKHKLIVAHEVTDEGNDNGQLEPMARAAKQSLQVESLTVVADTGYQNGKQGGECIKAGITPVVPRQRVVNTLGKDLFSKSQFVYDREHNQYRCPAGEVLSQYRTSHKKEQHHYTTSACKGCRLRSQCTDTKQRSITRSFYTDNVEAMDKRATDAPELMKQRRCLSEHPFGTLKRMTDNGRFLMRGITNVRAETALSVLSYNMLRVINILSVPTVCAELRP